MVIKTLVNKIHRLLNPQKYWKKQGTIFGNNCEIYSDVNFGSEPYLIRIGDNVRISQGVQLITHDGGVMVLRNIDPALSDADLFGNIVIGNNVHIGINAIIMPGVTIGDNCIIGCGAIVTKSIPSNSVCAGVPAKVIETLSDYKAKHINDFVQTKHFSPSEKKDFLLDEHSANH